MVIEKNAIEIENLYGNHKYFNSPTDLDNPTFRVTNMALRSDYEVSSRIKPELATKLS